MTSHNNIPQLDGENNESDEESEIGNEDSISHDTIPQHEGDLKEVEEESEKGDEDLIRQVTFIPDCQADWSDKAVHDLIVKKVYDAGLKPLSLMVERSQETKAFTSCEVNIESIPSSKCKELFLPFNGICTWKFG